VSEGLKNDPALAKLAASKKRMTAKSVDFRIVFSPDLLSQNAFRFQIRRPPNVSAG
jgi:hypothetical protein